MGSLPCLLEDGWSNFIEMSGVSMSRIDRTFEALRKADRKGFIAYITAGDPDLERTRRLVLEFGRRGVDLVELGVPFSDPLADGPVNQAAAQRALRGGATLRDVLGLVQDIREESEMPLVFFTYFNPVYRYGLECFADRAAAVGVDGVLMLDLPLEESAEYKALMDARKMDTVFIVAPTTPEQRIRRISEYATGFVYCTSRTGVTGERERLSEALAPIVERIRRYTDKPIGVGFGISTPDHVREASRHADAVIVGSAIVRRIGAGAEVAEVGRFVETLTAPLKGDAGWR